ncbi:hypothetical protein EDC32_10142 [Laceyella sacchari]|uniref:hypothetical protein n=1 Tax=Laceyella sacchari TaxID=37482 RepID=UPI0010473E6D|nr:hypothetical protein [Laceyella sacchari]TCW40402.1 hypothetical protein EDC32_10142 [Laceyella sacchari]
MKKRWYAIIACGLFALVSWSSATMLRSSSGGYEELITVWDLVMVSLGGPIAQDDVSFYEWSKWLILNLLFLVLIGNATCSEWVERATFVLPRYFTRSKWWIKKVLALGVTSFVYYFMAICTILVIGSSQFSWADHLGKWQGTDGPLQFNGIHSFIMLAWVFVLSWSTSLAMAVLQLALAVKWKSVFKPILFISVLYVVSCFSPLFGKQLIKWFPGNQGMFLRHTVVDPYVPSFSLSWSVFYNAIVLILSMYMGYLYVKKADIFGYAHKDSLQ